MQFIRTSLLQALYNPQMTRWSARSEFRAVDISPADRVPDAGMIRFLREPLTEAGRIEDLFRRFEVKKGAALHQGRSLFRGGKESRLQPW